MIQSKSASSMSTKGKKAGGMEIVKDDLDEYARLEETMTKDVKSVYSKLKQEKRSLPSERHRYRLAKSLLLDQWKKQL